MSVLTRIKNFLEHAEVTVSAAFTKIFGADAAETFAASAESLLKTELGKIAVTAVQDAATATSLSGAEKKAQAFSNITSAAKSAGIDASNSIINLLIETAVQRVGGAFGPATPAAPAPAASSAS